MDYQYGPFDGQPFLSPDHLFPQPQVMRFILQYGPDALEAMQNLDGAQEQQYIQQLIDAGLIEVEEDGQGGKRFRLTPKMLKGLQHHALQEIFESLKRGVKDGHRTLEHGRTTERSDGNRPYRFGDPLSEIDLGSTMRNAVHRQVAGSDRATDTAVGKPSLPIRITPADFDLHQTEGSADCATVMLIDLSGSMMRYGRFYQAKRVALGMQALINTRFPQDTLDYVGFYTLAERFQEKDIPLLTPKPVTVFDYQVRLRIRLTEAQANPSQVPLHFTNLQLGLRTARQILARSGAPNKQIFVITDGQPTAHVQPGPAGEISGGTSGGTSGGGGGGDAMLYLLYPPNELTAELTLKEALRCRQAGIRIASFALIEDYFGMDWVSFIERMTRLTRGIAYYCTSEDLSSTVIESYLTGRKRKRFVS